MPLYLESIDMLHALAAEEVDRYLDEYRKIVPLFEVDVAEMVTPYILQPDECGDELDQQAIQEQRQAEESHVSQ